jgi:hypothetical protein
MKNALEPGAFGLVAGLGAGAGIFYYRTLVEAHLARGLSAKNAAKQMAGLSHAVLLRLVRSIYASEAHRK